MAFVNEEHAAKTVMIHSSRSKKEYVPDSDICVAGDDPAVISQSQVTANTAHINSLLGQMQLYGGTLRLIDKYMIDESLLTFDGLHILGDYWETGLICDPRATPFNPFICTELDGVHFERFMMDGMVHQRAATDAAYGAIFLQHGVQNSAIEHLLLKRFGQNSAEGSGNYLTIQCNQTANRDTRANEINHVKVEDEGTGVFAIRLFTEFDNATPTDAYVRFVEDNTIYDLKCTGTTWSGVEIAGPGTVRNTLDTAVVKACFGPSGFDVDKGASYNTMKNLHVVDPVPDRGYNFAAFFDQGFITQVGGNLDRTAYGNKWSDLFVIGGTQEASLSMSVMNINNSVGAEVKGVTSTAATATGNAQALYGLQTFDCTDVKLRDFQTDGRYIGVLANQGVVGLDIDGADINNQQSGGSGARFTNDASGVGLHKFNVKGGSNGVQVVGTNTVVRGAIKGSKFEGQTYAALSCENNGRLFRGRVSGNTYDAATSTPIRVTDNTTFSYSENRHGDVEHTLV
jgi:hypothetical protein